MLSILNNVAAMAAQNQMSITNANMQKTLEQLSSGQRINSGADDAAGLSIADGLNANVAALTQSAQNATTSIGALQVADGALAQVTSLLNRAVTLATEAANSGLTTDQHTALNNELTSIKSEIDNIGETTTYNGSAIFGSGAGSGSTQATDPNTVVSSVAGGGGLGTNGVADTLTNGTTLVVKAGGATLDTFTVGGNDTLGTFVNTINSQSMANGDGIQASIGTDANGKDQLVLTDTKLRDDIAIDSSSTLETGGSGAVTFANKGLNNTNTLEGAAGVSAGTVVNPSSGGGGATGTWNNNGGTAGDLGGGINQTTTNGTVYLDDTISDGSTITIGGTQYTFKTALDGTANEIKIAAGNTTQTLQNLQDAISGANDNGSEYTAGTASDSEMVMGAIIAPGGPSQVSFAIHASTPGAGVADSIGGDTGSGIWYGGTTGTGAQASATLTLTSNLSTSSTLDIGNTHYTFIPNGITPTFGHHEIALGLTAADTASAIAAAITANSGDTSVTASISGNPDQITFTAATAGSAGNSLAATGSLIAATTGGTAQTLTVTAGGQAYNFSVAAGATVADVINTINNQGTPIAASLDPTTGKLMLTDTQDNGDITMSDGDGGVLVNNLAGGTLGDSSDTFTNPALMTSSNSLSVFLSDSTTTGTSTVNVALNTFNSSNLGQTGVGIVNNDLTTTTDAATALTAINEAISNVSALRGNIGAGVNQLQAATNVISAQTQNLQNASSNITSADIGLTVANMTKFSILSQTGMAAMAQANAMQKNILTLLQG